MAVRESFNLGTYTVHVKNGVMKPGGRSPQITNYTLKPGVALDLNGWSLAIDNACRYRCNLVLDAEFAHEIARLGIFIGMDQKQFPHYSPNVPTIEPLSRSDTLGMTSSIIQHVKHIIDPDSESEPESIRSARRVVRFERFLISERTKPSAAVNRAMELLTALNHGK